MSVETTQLYCNQSCPWWADGGRAGGVYYHDNLKLRASIFNKLGLSMQVVTDRFQLIKFLWLRVTTASMQCLRLSVRFLHFYLISQFLHFLC